MILNTLKLIIRTLLKNRFYSISLIFGFALSFASTGILAVFLIHEFNTDKFHKNYSEIYRVLMNDPITFEKSPLTFHQLPENLMRNFPEIIKATHLFYPGRTFIYKDLLGGDSSFKEEGLVYADTSFLAIFDFKFSIGDPINSLKNPKSIVLTETTANKYFGGTDVLGKNLYIKGDAYTVTGILENMPFNSHIKFNILISKSSLENSEFPLAYGGITYVLVNKKSSPDDLVNKMDGQQIVLLPYESRQKFTNPFQLQPLKDIYFYESKINSFLAPIIKFRDYSTLVIFAAIALIILVISLFNYVNFTQSKALIYSKANLIKRIFGAPMLLQMFQFFLESFLIVFISFSFSFLLITFFTGKFGSLVNSSISTQSLFTVTTVLVSFASVLCLSIVLGIFSYAFASKINKAVSNVPKFRVSGNRLKVLNSIFLVQLIGCLVLVSFTLVVMRQIQFIKRHDPGYFVENVVEVDLSALPRSFNPQIVKQEFNKLSQVVLSTVCTGQPLTGRWTSNLEVNGRTIPYSSYTGDVDFISTMGFEVLKGRGFNPMIFDDSSSVLVNESAYHLFELNENFESRNPVIRLPWKVIGVLKDFHYSSLKGAIGPVVVGYRKFNAVQFGGARLVFRTAQIDSTFLRIAESTWRKLNIGSPFEYSVVSKKIASLHEPEFKQLDLFLYGTGISLLICIFGIVGLSFFNTQKRTKEVAIRRVLGATPAKIALMFLFQLTKVVLIATLVSIPIIHYASSQWMAQFVFKSPPSFLVLFSAFALMLFVMTAAVLYQVIDVVRRNPSESLRHE